MNYRTIANVVALAVVLALVLPFVVYAVPGVIGADHSFLVLSGSMEPEISAGDAVIVEETDPATIEEGDVVTFVRNEDEAPVTHRVVEVRDGDDGLAFETKGDANEERDSGAVPAENVIGTVVWTIPFIGHVIQFANTTLGFALLVGLPIGLLVLTEVWSLVRQARAGSKAGDERTADDARSDGPDSPSSTVAETNEASVAETDDAAEADTITMDLTDLTMTLTLLAVLLPYAVYVALQLRTTLTFLVAFAVCFSTLLLGGLRASLWLSEGQYRDRSADSTSTEAETAGESVATTDEGDRQSEITIVADGESREREDATSRTSNAEGEFEQARKSTGTTDPVSNDRNVRTTAENSDSGGGSG